MGARVIAIANQKGGVGKTVTSINLAAFLATRGRRTLLIDLDPQGHCGVGLGIDTEAVERTSFDLLCRRDVSVSDVAMPVPWPSLFSSSAGTSLLELVPANLRLALAERELSQVSLPNLALASRLKQVKDRYDEVVIDCPPSLSKLTLNAFLACDMVIIPVGVGFFSIHGVRMLAETLRDIFEETGLDYDLRCLMTRYRPGQTVSREMLDAARQLFGDHVLSAVIRENVEVEKSIGAQMPLIEYNPTCAAAQDYRELADELCRELEGEPLLAPPGDDETEQEEKLGAPA